MFHRAISADAVDIGASNKDKTIDVTLLLRRRPGHESIPNMSEYIGCSPRPALPEDEFVQKYGASDEDIKAIGDHYKSFGLTVEEHKARRHLYLTGSVGQFNKAFNVTLRDHRKLVGKHMVEFHAHKERVTIPDHLSPLILNIFKLNAEPVLRPKISPGPAVQSNFDVSFYNSIYGAPTNSGAGQTIAIVAVPGWGAWQQSDINNTCSHYGITPPNITTIAVDGSNLGPQAGELLLDISMCALFGGGADIAIYSGGSFTEIISRITFPQSGEPHCSVITLSGGSNENFESLDVTAYEDAAINGITIFVASGDNGATDGSATSSGIPGNIAVSSPASVPYVTGVGGTTVGANSGTVSPSNFVEWIWNRNRARGQVTGGGVSINYPLPDYQEIVIGDIPTTLSPISGVVPVGSVGRGVPDIAAVADIYCVPEIYFEGTLQQIGGTSLASPLMAGIFARVNAALGYNVGFINPTLYWGRASFMRPIDAGGFTTNAMEDLAIPGTNWPGYSVTTVAGHWCACTGLGMVNANSFIDYITSFNNAYWVEVIATDSAGTATSQVSGPFFVPSGSSTPTPPGPPTPPPPPLPPPIPPPSPPTPPPILRPSKVTGVTITAGLGNSLNISWNGQSGDNTYVIIASYSNNAGSWYQVGNTKALSINAPFTLQPNV